MPRIIHVVEADYTPTFRSSKVAGMFDVPVAEKLRKEWDVIIPIEEKPWQIGLITGASGSGKTTLAKKLFGEKVHNGFDWKKSCLLDDFPEGASVKDITEILSKVGFSSPPSWLLPYHVLSNGQKFRVELARCLLEYKDLFVFDEFTSVVDRQVAQIGAFAFQKAIRKTQQQFVAVTCHDDVEAWLQPDWVFDASGNQFKWGSLRRPPLTIEICRVHYSAWQLFKEHHYLNANLHRSAACYVGFLDGVPVCFDAWIPFFGNLGKNVRGMRSHRSVVLPDYQGLGIGNRIFTELARMWAGLGYRVFSRTAHPAEIKKRVESKEWRITSQGRSRMGQDVQKSRNRIIKHASDRLTLGSEFVGIPMAVEDAKKLHAG